jgi:hypothetical protein
MARLWISFEAIQAFLLDRAPALAMTAWSAKVSSRLICAGPQLDDLLGSGLKTRHFHLDLIGRLLASFPGVSDNSVGLKQN